MVQSASKLEIRIRKSKTEIELHEATGTMSECTGGSISRRTRIDTRGRGQYPVDRSTSGNEDRSPFRKGIVPLDYNVTRSIVSGKSFSSKRSEGEFVTTLCAGTKSIDRFRKSRMRSRRILSHSLANKSSVAVTLTLNDAVMNIVMWSRLK